MPPESITAIRLMCLAISVFSPPFKCRLRAALLPPASSTMAWRELFISECFSCNVWKDDESQMAMIKRDGAFFVRSDDAPGA